MGNKFIPLFAYLLKVWKSASEASHIFSNPNSARVAINNNCLEKTHQSFGYYWSYKCKFNYISTGTAVAKYNDAGVFLESYSSIKEAAMKSAHLRLRPILMTTFAMVIGSFPLVFSSGAGSESRRAIGLTLVGGLSVGTFLTLTMIPFAYVMFKGLTEKKSKEG